MPAADSLGGTADEDDFEGQARWKKKQRSNPRKRRSRASRAAEGFPTAPLSLEETAAMSAQADDRSQLSDALWNRLRRRAAEVVGQEIETTKDISESRSGRQRDGALSGRRKTVVETIDDGIEAAREMIRLRVWERSSPPQAVLDSFGYNLDPELHNVVPGKIIKKCKETVYNIIKGIKTRKDTNTSYLKRFCVC